MNEIKVLLADDTLIAREGWTEILNTVENLKIVGKVANAPKTLTEVKRLKPDVLLMDLMWFGDETAGATAISKIKQVSPQTKIIAVTAYRHLISEARRAGADAALEKGFSKSDLVDLIRAVCDLPDSPPNDNIKPTDRSSIARLAAGIGIPTLGFILVTVVLVWGIQSLSIWEFAIVIIASLIAYFFGVIFAGRYVDVIGETTTYKLFLKVFDLFRVKLPDIKPSNFPPAGKPKENNHSDPT